MPHSPSYQTQLESTVELVWIGPTTPFAAIRRTEQVLLDLIAQAQSELFLVSFVAYDVSSVADALNAAAARSVDIRIMLEASTSQVGAYLVIL